MITEVPRSVSCSSKALLSTTGKANQLLFASRNMTLRLAGPLSWRVSRRAGSAGFRCFSTTTPWRMGSASQALKPPAFFNSPSDAYQLLPDSEKIGTAEEALFDQQIQSVKDWWSSKRYEGIKRPYSAEDVVSKRGSLQQTYPSSIMARKLFNLLKTRAAKGEPVHTSTLGSIFDLETRLTIISGCH